MSAQFGPMFSARDHTGFVRRTVALFLDVAMLVGVRIGARAVCVLLDVESGDNRAGLPPAMLVGWVLLSFAYMIGMRLTDGGTLGYRICGIRYAYMFEGRPSSIWRLSRALWAFFLLVTFGLDHFWIIFDPQKQAWHDKVSGSYVVKRRAEPIGTQRIVQRVVTIIGANFVVWEPARSDSG